MTLQESRDPKPESQMISPPQVSEGASREKMSENGCRDGHSQSPWTHRKKSDLIFALFEKEAKVWTPEQFII
jgi:hypothetical protein